MQVRLPPDTRRDFDWLMGLSGEGLLVATGGVLVTLGIWHAPWPQALRIIAAVLLLAVTAGLAWGRWPMEEGGDRLTVWAQRLVQYLLTERNAVQGGWFRGPQA